MCLPLLVLILLLSTWGSVVVKAEDFKYVSSKYLAIYQELASKSLWQDFTLLAPVLHKAVEDYNNKVTNAQHMINTEHHDFFVDYYLIEASSKVHVKGLIELVPNTPQRGQLLLKRVYNFDGSHDKDGRHDAKLEMVTKLYKQLCEDNTSHEFEALAAWDSADGHALGGEPKKFLEELAKKLEVENKEVVQTADVQHEGKTRKVHLLGLAECTPKATPNPNPV